MAKNSTPDEPAATKPKDQSRKKAAEFRKSEEHAQRWRAVLIVGCAVLVGALIIAGALFARSNPSVADTSTPSGPVVNPANTVGASYIVGNPSAPVTLQVYEDFQCPVCEVYEKALGTSLTTLVDEGKVQLNYHMMSFLGPESVRAANAAACAADQGKFAAYHQLLYANQPPERTDGYKTQELLNWGAQVGLTNDQFTSCVSSNKFAPYVASVQSDSIKAGIVGTPTFVLNGKPLARPNGGPLPPAEILAAVEQATAATSAAPSTTQQ